MFVPPFALHIARLKRVKREVSDIFYCMFIMIAQ